MKKSIQILEYIRKNGPKNVDQVRNAGLIPQQKNAYWYHLRQRGFLKTLYVDDSGLLVCDITEKGKQNIIKAKRREMFVPFNQQDKNVAIDKSMAVTVTVTENTKFTKSKSVYEVYKQPKNFMERMR